MCVEEVHGAHLRHQMVLTKQPQHLLATLLPHRDVLDLDSGRIVPVTTYKHGTFQVSLAHLGRQGQICLYYSEAHCGGGGGVLRVLWFPPLLHWLMVQPMK